MRKHILLFYTLFIYISISAYTPQDSTRIESILAKAIQDKTNSNKTLYIARQFLGTPYVAHTLDRDNEEHLVINTRELDCTTYVETVTALRLCLLRGEKTFNEYKKQLQRLRYNEGNVAYVNRLHYFTSWIESNVKKGFVKKIESKEAPFSAIQKLNVNYMSSHYKSYSMLAKHPEWVSQIKQTEKQLTGKKYYYIPKNKLGNTKLLRNTIHDGDIIAILTSKKGLDTSHIGIAVWHKDGLHLLNASQIHKEVVEESMTLGTYMKKHPTQTGIRVCRMVL